MAERMTDLATSVIVGDTGSPALAAVGGFGMGIADGRFAAAIAARQAAARGSPVIVASGIAATADFLAPLPVHLLASVAGIDDEFLTRVEE